jgi:antitoxin FitA
MPQIIVRQLPEEVHRALKVRAQAHGRSTEAEARDIIASAVLPDVRPQAGDLLCGIWTGADVSGVTFERDVTPHEPMRFGPLEPQAL